MLKCAEIQVLVYCFFPSFGINHDGIDNTCSSSGFMMASDGGYNSVDLTWSQCSRAQLHNFFRCQSLTPKSETTINNVSIVHVFI